MNPSQCCFESPKLPSLFLLTPPVYKFSNMDRKKRPIDVSSNRKKSVADFLEERERAKRTKTLTQCFREAKTSKNSVPTSEDKDKNKRLVEEWKNGSYVMVEYDTERKYGLYKRRFGEPVHPGECINYIQCVDCKQHDCGLCRIEDIADTLIAQEDEAHRRWCNILDRTTYLRGTEELDQDWMRQQDPVWAQLVDNNKEMKEDLILYINKIEKKVAAVKEQIGWE